MISDIDYMKFAMSQERDKTEIDPVLRSKAWSAVILGLAMFWKIGRASCRERVSSPV